MIKVHKEFASYIREAREKKYLSQYQLADIVGVHYMSIYNWENGKASITVYDAERVCAALGITFTLGYGDSFEE